MSALGQKPTFAVQNGMSAFPPKADMAGAVGILLLGEQVPPQFAREEVRGDF